MSNTELLLDIESILSKYNSEKLENYYSILRQENEKLNLVSRETIEKDLPQLTAESLLPLEKIQQSTFENYLDIGAGGGLPSIPLLLSGKINKSLLVERVGKKAKSLDRMIDFLKITSVKVENYTLEDIKFSHKFDLITMRLVKLTDRLFKIISNNLSENGFFIYYHKPEIEINFKLFSLVTYSYSISPNSPNKYFSLISKKV